jgi:23S rRNA pseudouridine2605 synthase
MTDTPEGDRIAKVLSRAGIASRREAERMIELGQVTVNGKVITSPALNVTPKDRITVAGQPVLEPDVARLWLYYKPDGLVTSTSDEKGRETVFDHLPPDLPRVMPVGRLDLNSEGLLLLTNDGELKRRLELPSTGWLRRYRVRVRGNPVDPDLEPLRKGMTVEGERFQPMIVSLDRVQGANAWLTVGLREGKNREIRRAMTAIGLTVNRLIRVSYGPFRLGDMEPGDVEEVRGKTLRDQLGLPPASEDMTGTARSKLARTRPGGAATKSPPAPPGIPLSRSARGEAPPDRPAPKPARPPDPRPGTVRTASAAPETGAMLRSKPKAARPATSRNAGPTGPSPKKPPRRGK